MGQVREVIHGQRGEDVLTIVSAQMMIESAWRMSVH